MSFTSTSRISHPKNLHNAHKTNSAHVRSGLSATESNATFHTQQLKKTQQQDSNRSYRALQSDVTSNAQKNSNRFGANNKPGSTFSQRNKLNSQGGTENLDTYIKHFAEQAAAGELKKLWDHHGMNFTTKVLNSNPKDIPDMLINKLLEDNGSKHSGSQISAASGQRLRTESLQQIAYVVAQILHNQPPHMMSQLAGALQVDLHQSDASIIEEATRKISIRALALPPAQRSSSQISSEHWELVPRRIDKASGKALSPLPESEKAYSQVSGEPIETFADAPRRDRKNRLCCCSPE